MTPKELSQKARELVGQGWVLLDVRTPEEYRQGHPEPARNIPVQELAGRVAELGPPSTRVVVYCQAGGRSAAAMDILRRHGFQDLFDLKSVHHW